MHLLIFRFKALGYFLRDEKPDDDGKVLLFPHYSVVHCLINAPSPVEKETNYVFISSCSHLLLFSPLAIEILMSFRPTTFGMGISERGKKADK